ncbi:DNA-deoxyinosine glycosylase [Bifidobacterium sp. MA2]|uniref:DNA-deoxyinosine glycosylase n=2 Tax=Bifidobacterium santillanense TaxID=2809028 RepID=A0ABS5UN61_9BIFI|nr:DNA-deoxyinosine glycosylase [Bifidobacterium santillanense]
MQREETDGHARNGTTVGDGARLTHVEHGFGPVWDAHSRVLVLGSMPSPKSREAAFYYMHPRNRFWPVMEALFADPADPTDLAGDSPSSRRAFALRHHVALWDVIASCDIVGASDASIRNAVPNDLTPILGGAPIGRIVTTGAKAAQLYRRLIAPGLAGMGFDVPTTPLPSTSPANASMSLERLVDVYREAFREAGLPVATAPTDASM